jgi:hypothetical protein
MNSLLYNDIDLGKAFDPGWVPTLDASRTCPDYGGRSQANHPRIFAFAYKGTIFPAPQPWCRLSEERSHYGHQFV